MAFSRGLVEILSEEEHLTVGFDGPFFQKPDNGMMEHGLWWSTSLLVFVVVSHFCFRPLGRLEGVIVGLPVTVATVWLRSVSLLASLLGYMFLSFLCFPALD